MKRAMDIKRKLDAKKAIRKQKLWKEIYREYNVEIPLHKFSKGKIHCSCPLCAAKTAKRTYRFGTSGRMGKNWKPADIRRVNAVDMRYEEYQAGYQEAYYA